MKPSNRWRTVTRARVRPMYLTSLIGVALVLLMCWSRYASFQAYVSRQRTYSVVVTHGFLVLNLFSRYGEPERPKPTVSDNASFTAGWSAGPSEHLSDVGGGQLGIAIQHEVIRDTAAASRTRWALTIHLLYLALASIIPLCLATVSDVRRRFRRSHGRCEKCGYDLRASGTRCPECGYGS